MNIKRLFNDEAGVSPIVATLVLVVVAIAGAAAVGTILGSFSSDVSDSASSDSAAMGASTELLIAGSTTIQPVSEKLAEAFMKKTPGIKVSVQAGGSGAGIASTKMGIVDIGAASEDVDTVTTYPELKKHQIGASAVVFVNGTGVTVTGPVSKADIKKIYDDANTNGGVVTMAPGTYANISSTGNVTVLQRSESSGTEDTASGYIMGDVKTKDFFDKLTKVKGVNGNAGMVAEMTSNPNTIGFVDIGFAINSAAVTAIPVDSMTVTSESDIKKESLKTLKGQTSTFPALLTRPLNYLTLGEPSTIEKAFISFAKEPSQKGIFESEGYFSMYDIA
jgi:phosphate transport system substrate-binding protein